MSDLQHSKQLLVPSPSSSSININRDISADAVLIIRRVRPENAPAVNALVERPVRDWQRRSDEMVQIYNDQVVRQHNTFISRYIACAVRLVMPMPVV